MIASIFNFFSEMKNQGQVWDILSNITGKKLKQNHIQRETDAKV